MYIPFTQVIDLFTQAYNDGYSKGREDAYQEQDKAAQFNQANQVITDAPGAALKGSRR